MSILYYAHLVMLGLILAYDWPHTHAALKVLHLLYYNPASARLTLGLLMVNALIQLKIIQYWWCFWRQWCRDVASGTDRHVDIIFRLQLVESSSLVSILFREVFNHPYTSPFSFTSKCFFVIIIIIINFIRRVFSECMKWMLHQLYH